MDAITTFVSTLVHPGADALSAAASEVNEEEEEVLLMCNSPVPQDHTRLQDAGALVAVTAATSRTARNAVLSLTGVDATRKIPFARWDQEAGQNVSVYSLGTCDWPLDHDSGSTDITVACCTFSRCSPYRISCAMNI